MIDEDLLDLYFNSFANDIRRWLPDGFIEVNLSLLQKHNLLKFDKKEESSSITHFFHLVESEDKLTLYNEQFVIWITPDSEGEYPTTYTLIAINREDTPHLEIAYRTTGVYNTSHYLLYFLEHYLGEIRENEEMMDRLKHGF